MSIELLSLQIRTLQKALARNGFELNQNKRNTTRLIELMHARMEIYKSIAHRQGLIIEALKARVKFAELNHDTKEAA